MKRVFYPICVLILCAGGLGCAGPLAMEKAPRTQYERYARLHGSYTPVTRSKAIGWGEPLLRERLLPAH